MTTSPGHGQSGAGTTDAERWAVGAPKVAMALNEAGYPCHFEEVHFHLGGLQQNVIVFDAPRPALDVLVKAGDVCGIGDLMRTLYEDR